MYVSVLLMIRRWRPWFQCVVVVLQAIANCNCLKNSRFCFAICHRIQRLVFIHGCYYWLMVITLNNSLIVLQYILEYPYGVLHTPYSYLFLVRVGVLSTPPYSSSEYSNSHSYNNYWVIRQGFVIVTVNTFNMSTPKWFFGFLNN